MVALLCRGQGDWLMATLNPHRRLHQETALGTMGADLAIPLAEGNQTMEEDSSLAMEMAKMEDLI